MGEAMAGATKAMGAMNKRMNLPAVAKIMRDFEMQNERMEMTSEMMGDAGGWLLWGPCWGGGGCRAGGWLLRGPAGGGGAGRVGGLKHLSRHRQGRHLGPSVGCASCVSCGCAFV